MSYLGDTYLIKLVHICSPVNQQLCSLSVTSLTGSQEWGFPILKKNIWYVSYITVSNNRKLVISDLFMSYLGDTYLIKLVHICSPVNQQLCSLSVTSLTGSQEWGFPILKKNIWYVSYITVSNNRKLVISDLFMSYLGDTYLIKQVYICSPVNQQLCSLSVTSLTGSQEWGVPILKKNIWYVSYITVRNYRKSVISDLFTS